VTHVAERQEVFFCVVSGMTSKFLVVNLKVLPATTVLTLPVVALEDLSLQQSIGFRFKPDARCLGPDRGHEAVL
jgi:hypothetical protein